MFPFCLPLCARSPLILDVPRRTRPRLTYVDVPVILWENKEQQKKEADKVRDYVQQEGDPSVAALCVRDQGFSDCCKL